MRFEIAFALAMIAGPALADDLDCSDKALSTGVQSTLNACAAPTLSAATGRSTSPTAGWPASSMMEVALR